VLPSGVALCELPLEPAAPGSTSRRETRSSLPLDSVQGHRVAEFKVQVLQSADRSAEKCVGLGVM